MQGTPQFTPQQLLEAGRRAEAEGKLDYAGQFYRHLTDHFAYTSEAAEARNGLGRIGAAPAPAQVWHTAPNGHTPPTQARNGKLAQSRSRPVAHRDYYRTGRILAALLSGIGWLVVALGCALVPLYLSIDARLLHASVPYAAYLGTAGAIAAAVATAIVGLCIVFWGQLARAIIDQANATRELVAIERARNGAGHS